MKKEYGLWDNTDENEYEDDEVLNDLEEVEEDISKYSEYAHEALSKLYSHETKRSRVNPKTPKHAEAWH